MIMDEGADGCTGHMGAVPRRVRYNRGIFVVEQIQELSKLCNVTVIAPVGLPLTRKKFHRVRQLVAEIPVQSTLGQAIVYQPGFLGAPRSSEYMDDWVVSRPAIRCVGKHDLRVDLVHGHLA